MTQEQQGKSTRKSFYKEWIEPFLIAAAVALFIRQFGVEAFKIPSGSMIPTLTIGDHLLVNKFVYGPRIPFTDTRIFAGKAPKRGEIIVFRFPRDESKNFIKRVVGLPGDKIELRKGKLFINDKLVAVTAVGVYDGDDQRSGPPYYDKPMLLDEQLGPVKHAILYLHDQAGSYGPTLVPEDSVFVMGDNRDNSQDSRFWGFVKQNKILGRALIIYWSWDGDHGRWVRWERLGNLIR